VDSDGGSRSLAPSFMIRGFFFSTSRRSASMCRPQFLLEHGAPPLPRPRAGVLWATHLIDEVGDDARVIVLHGGRILADGPVGDVVAVAGVSSIDAAFRGSREAGRTQAVTERRLAKRGTGRIDLAPLRLGISHYARCLEGIVWREWLRFSASEAACLRACPPVVWLGIFAAGFRSRLASRSARLRDLCPLEVYVVHVSRDDPAVQRHAEFAFDGLRSRDGQHARSADEPPSPLVSLGAKLLAALSSGAEVYAFLRSPSSGSRGAWSGYITVLPALVLSGMMLGALGLLLSSTIRQLENFAG